jgi:alkanesulfonate monooxygenase SsuD/methylene tetrahydromethanopterin reductase-like flavin-dependent oxidoreductase (luciferase family)
MRYGVVILPDQRWADGGDRWRHAEELGLDHAWTYDHLSWRTLRDGPWMAAVPTLAAAALSTSGIGLGLLVASPNFRHPVPFAKELVALDDLSGGRLVAGLGAGGAGWDAQVLGQAPWSPAERVARFAEFVELCDRLLRRPEDVSYEGRFYAATEARNLPGCLHRPRLPFAVAAAGTRTMEVAAAFGQAWVTTGDPARRSGMEEGVAVVRAQGDRLTEVCEAAGRDPATVDRIVLLGPSIDQPLASPGQFADAAGRFAEVGVTDLVVHWPRPGEPYAGTQDTFEAALAARP